MKTTATPSLDILIPTFNRADMLRECLESILALHAVPGFDWRVTVIDNNSTDNTKAVTLSFAEKFAAGRFRYLFQPKQGRSAALNMGITTSDKDLIGMIDDDELLDPSWLSVVAECFQNPQLDYIGGPYIGNWKAERPSWILKDAWGGVLGIDYPENITSQPKNFADGGVEFLRGGNAVVRKAVFDRIGLYEETLGRKAKGLASCEDQEMFNRLKSSGALGFFIPKLVILHAIPQERLERSYWRRWAWDHAVSRACMNSMNPEKVAYVGKVPRYLLGRGVRGLKNLASRDTVVRLRAELDILNAMGFVYGAYFQNE